MQFYQEFYVAFGILWALQHHASGKVSQNITSIQGETVVLGCKLDLPNLNLQRSWTNQSRVIYANSLRLPQDKRISLFDNGKSDYAVEIKRVTVHDEADYTCTAYYNTKIEQYTVHLQVYVPPQIWKVSQDVTLDEGQTTILECFANGKPQPKILWRHLIPSVDRIRATSSYLPLAKIRRENAGTYECSAHNSVSSPDKANIKVTVRYAPTMEPPPLWTVENAIYTQAELQCQASSEPTPTFKWEHPNGKTFERTVGTTRVRVLNIKRGNTVTSKLIIGRTNENDFGNFTCIASNVRGTTNRTIILKRVKQKLTRPPPGNIFFGSNKSNPGNGALSSYLMCSVIFVNVFALAITTFIL